MFQRFIRVWEFLAYSLWASPLLFATGGTGLALLAIAFPQSLPAFWPGFDQLATVRDLFGTLLATLVTMTTFALSITMVVLTLAAGSLGPRMIRNFMGDSKTQNALGSFVGSILFLITSLVLIAERPENAPVPQLTATVGVVLFVLCVFVLILFVHHLGRSIVADDVIQRIGRNLEETIQSARKTLQDPIQDAKAAKATLPDTRNIEDSAALCAICSGYVQGIDYEKLCTIAQQKNVCISLVVRAGQHVIEGEVIGHITSPAATDIADCRTDMCETILIGDHRTAMLDVEFSLRQLVEVALRALSPGINDPFTAIAVVYRLGRALPHAMTFTYPVGIWRDADGIIRIQATLPDFTGMLGAAFNQIRQAAHDKPDVLLPMAEMIERLTCRAHSDPQRTALHDHARMIARTAERGIPEENDRKAVETAVKRILHRRNKTS